MDSSASVLTKTEIITPSRNNNHPQFQIQTWPQYVGSLIYGVFMIIGLGRFILRGRGLITKLKKAPPRGKGRASIAETLNPIDSYRARPRILHVDF